jgi:hypothetical protein
LTFEGRDKSVFYGGRRSDLEFYIQLGDLLDPGVDYRAIQVAADLQAEVDRILETFVQVAPRWNAIGRPGYVISNPPGAQFDDVLVLLPEDVGQVGIAESRPELEAEIVAVRDRTEPGKQGHFWGTLTCNVPDVGGCQLWVTRLRYGASDIQPSTCLGWMGTLVGNPPGAQFDDYFVLSGRFGVAYGIHSLDPDQQTQLEALRDTGTPFRVWGVLRCGVPDAFGSQIDVTRIEP